MPLTNLFYLNEYEWEPLPDWAHYYLSLGALIAAQPKSETRLIAGLALPTRAYAAALAALGVVSQQTTAHRGYSAEGHFQRLCDLPSGVAVTYLHGKRNLDGVLLGCTDKFGERRLIVQTRNPRSGGDTHYVAARDSMRIQPSGEAEQLINPQELPDQQTGTLVRPACSFVSRLFGAENVSDFTTRSRLDCLIVGRLSSLRHEISETVFRSFLPTDRPLDTTDDEHEGTLLDALRVRKFLSEGKAYRTDAVAANSQSVPTMVRDSTPHVAVFDAASGFVKWRGYWRSSHWIILLDATESGFDEAARALNAEYVNRISDDAPDGLPAPPAGVELVFYREKCA